MSIDVGSVIVWRAQSVGTGSAKTRRISLELMDKSHAPLWLVTRSRFVPLIGWAPCPDRAALPPCVGHSDSGDGDNRFRRGWRGSSQGGPGSSQCSLEESEGLCRLSWRSALAQSNTESYQSLYLCQSWDLQSDGRQQAIKVTTLHLTSLSDLWLPDGKLPFNS